MAAKQYASSTTEHKLVRRIEGTSRKFPVTVRCLGCKASTPLLGPKIRKELIWYQAVHDLEVSSS